MSGSGPAPMLVWSAAQPRKTPVPRPPRWAARALPGPWAAQPASHADVTTPRPRRALQLRLPGEGSGVGRRGQQCRPESCPGQEGKGETERERHTVKDRKTQRDPQSKSRSKTEEEGACVCRFSHTCHPSFPSPLCRWQGQPGRWAAGTQVRMGCPLS